MVDWKAVVAGERPLRVRQLPGADNMMGQIKFMMPNDLGIYLHDTPNKAPFSGPERALSAGCVRLLDAERLSRLLLGRTPAELATGEPEQRVDLARPVPVYITYLTVSPRPEGVLVSRDVYGRDPTLLASL
jgi:murein L,D-transpeptidase YcbB/YkuD